MEHSHSLLSKPAILSQLGHGIIIHPFNLEQLKTCSYDVRLGRYYYRRRRDSKFGAVFNPYDPEEVGKHFDGPSEAVPASSIRGYGGDDWRGVDPDDLVILFDPNELILGHTEEFVGGSLIVNNWGSTVGGPDLVTEHCFTAEMKARSSIGRIGFEICRCAGWGDVGYVNRWTMEIKNDDPQVTFLVTGTRVAQMKFYEVDPVNPKDLYGADTGRDHYQGGVDIDSIMANWKPEMLLPRLTKD